jgi:hypothetical protein
VSSRTLSYIYVLWYPPPSRFDTLYTPWLQFFLVRSQAYSILELACCLIASRHLDSTFRPLLAPQLQKLTEDTVLQLLLNPRAYESMQSIQALLVLSLWMPVCGLTDSTIWHGSLLIASAVDMAMAMKLNEASKEILTVPADSPRFQDLQDKARLVCLSSLLPLVFLTVLFFFLSGLRW